MAGESGVWERSARDRGENSERIPFLPFGIKASRVCGVAQCGQNCLVCPHWVLCVH